MLTLPSDNIFIIQIFSAPSTSLELFVHVKINSMHKLKSLHKISTHYSNKLKYKDTTTLNKTKKPTTKPQPIQERKKKSTHQQHIHTIKTCTEPLNQQQK